MNRCTVAEQWQLNGNARRIPLLLPRYLAAVTFLSTGHTTTQWRVQRPPYFGTTDAIEQCDTFLPAYLGFVWYRWVRNQMKTRHRYNCVTFIDFHCLRSSGKGYSIAGRYKRNETLPRLSGKQKIEHECLCSRYKGVALILKSMAMSVVTIISQGTCRRLNSQIFSKKVPTSLSFAVLRRRIFK